MEGLLSILKYLLVFFNFVIFIVGIVVFGLAVWVIADAPKFMDLFEKTREVVGSDVDTAALQLNIYTSVVYAFLVIAGIFVIVAFFGCCGAWKENKCMLGTYFLLITILLIAVVTFGIAVYKGDLLDQLETPLLQSVKMYQDNPKGSETDIKKKEAFKEVWNVIQRDMKCCGVVTANDWRNVTQPNWDPSTALRPEGCCKYQKDSQGNSMEIPAGEILTCREKVYSSELMKTYYFDGCLSKFKEQVVDNKEVIIWVAIATLMILVVTLLVTLAMCMRAQ